MYMGKDNLICTFDGSWTIYIYTQQCIITMHHDIIRPKYLFFDHVQAGSEELKLQSLVLSSYNPIVFNYLPLSNPNWG